MHIFFVINKLYFNRPKALSYKGKDVGNVFHLRTPEDANSIATLASSKNAVIVGTSFIGKSLCEIYIMYVFSV